MKRHKKFWVVCHENGTAVLPIDCNEPEYDGKTPDAGMLVYRTKAGAKASAEHQNVLYELDCHARLLQDVVFSSK